MLLQGFKAASWLLTNGEGVQWPSAVDFCLDSSVTPHGDKISNIIKEKKRGKRPS